MDYYYFVAALPMINTFESKPPLSVAYFLKEARQLLEREDFILTENLLTEDKRLRTKNNFYNAWKTFEHNLKNELAYLRAQRANRDPLDYLRGERVWDPQLTEIIQEALRAPHLLAAEKILDQRKWEHIERFSSGHYFDAVFVFAYGLKLKILQRYENINSAEAVEKLEEYKKIGQEVTI